MMIRIERYEPESHPNLGYIVESDGLSNEKQYDMSQRASRRAIDRYLSDRERLYEEGPDDLEGTLNWVVHGLGRIPWLWEEFQVYYLLARLRILLAEKPRDVECVADVNDVVDSAVADLCEEFDVEYRPNADVTSTNDQKFHLESCLNAFGHEIQSPVFTAAAILRIWLIYAVFIVFRPLFLKLYGLSRVSSDVRLWLNPFKDHSHRFYDVKTDLESQGHTVGRAVYDEAALMGVKSFIWREFGALRKAVASEEPIHAEWYVKPERFRRVISVTSRLRSTIRRFKVGDRQSSVSPEFTYLIKQVKTISTNIAFQGLLMEASMEGFSRKFDDDVWVHARPPTKDIPRIMAVVCNRHDISCVAIAPHYYSTTRISSRFTDIETTGPESISLPDLNVVFEPLSAKRYLEQGIQPHEIGVARDRFESEAGVLRENATVQNCSECNSSISISPPETNPLQALVVLDLPSDNSKLLDSIAESVENLSNIKFVFKPHPFYPPEEDDFDGLPDGTYEVTPPNESLESLVRECDICIAMYSTVAFAALARATPVVWVPFASPNHVMMDLVNRVGIRADDAAELGEVIDRLSNNESLYLERAEECLTFAKTELIPDIDSPSIADMIDRDVLN